VSDIDLQFILRDCGGSAPAAQRRIDRAVERLRAQLAEVTKERDEAVIAFDGRRHSEEAAVERANALLADLESVKAERDRLREEVERCVGRPTGWYETELNRLKASLEKCRRISEADARELSALCAEIDAAPWVYHCGGEPVQGVSEVAESWHTHRAKLVRIEKIGGGE
jgi:chromosome segregation ATPase